VSEHQPIHGPVHAFSVQLAELYGVECAIMIHHLQSWIQYNMDEDKNFHDGRTWTYQTHNKIANHFPYWSEDAVRRIMNKLEEFGVIIKGNYNKTSYDRTIWYSFENEKMFTIRRNRGMENAKSPNPKCETASPIPNNKTNTKEKQQQDGVGSSSIHIEKMRSLGFKEKDIIEITNQYQEASIQHAIDYATHPSTPIKKTLIACFKWACRELPELPKDSKESIEENKKFVKKYDGMSNKNMRIDVLTNEIEFIFVGSQKSPIVVSFNDKDFKNRFLCELKKFKFEELK
jgi:hypothetical protein